MIYSFGNCELDSEAYEFYRDAQKVEIERRVFDILLYLLENRGRLISRDELLDNCWPGMYVSDGTLTTSLGRVRRAVSVGQQNHEEIIKTVRGKGYRFLADVIERPSSTDKEPAPDSEANSEVDSKADSEVDSEAAPPDAPPAAVADAAAKIITEASAPLTAQRQTAALTEMRQLTVLNCVLRDTQTLLASHDPEQLHDIMQTYHSLTREVIERFDGHLVHHLQDTILVYFGYPMAHEDDAQRAIRCGLQLLEVLTPQRLNIAIGIHNGPVITKPSSDTANLTPMAAGVTVAIAEQLSRLPTLAGDAVIISEAIARLTAGHFDWQALSPLPVTGQSERLHCYQVLTDKQQTRLQVNQALRGLTPYISRSAEQALLLARWHQVCDGHGQSILLSGDAGIGKSRLLQTLAKQQEIASQQWFECQCSPYHQNTPFYPLINFLVQLLQWQDEHNAEQRLQALESFLTTYQLALDEAIPLLAERLSLTIPGGRYPPLPQDSQQQHQQLLELLVTLLLEIQQEADQPLLFVLEDLHWIDPSTLKFIDLLITQVAMLPIMVVLTARPEFKTAWTTPELLTPLSLTRFSSDQIEQMLLRITGGKILPDSVLQHIVEKADGVPLFIEEMAHNLLESGQLQETEQNFELNGALAQLSIPLTLQDSLMARLDRMGEAKEVARWGAVIGREFSYRLLATVVPFDEDLLQQHLGALISSGLIHQRGLARRASYSFKHALVQDITYQSLLKRQRQEFHQRIAKTLENRFPEHTAQQPELLARHYEAAEQLEPALRYWQQAGDKAVQGSALREALAHFSHALALLRELPVSETLLRTELALHISLGPLWDALKGQAAEEVKQTYQRADELCQQLGETTQRFPILWGLWRLHNNRADLPTARALAQQLLDLAQQQPDDENNSGLLMEARLACANNAITLGEFSAAHQHIQQGLALYQREQHQSMTVLFSGWEPGAYMLSNATFIHWFLGYPQQALQLCNEVLARARQLSEPYTLVSTLYYCAIQHILLRNIEKVQILAEELVERATKHGFSTRLYIGQLQLGWALTRQDNRAEEGFALMQEGLTASKATDNLLGFPVWHYLLVDAYVASRQYAEALPVLADTFAIIKKTRERTLLAEFHRLHGECCDQQNNPQQAEASFQQALQIAREQQAKSLELRSAMSLARLWQKQHKQHQAYEQLFSVYDWFSEGFASTDLQDAKNLLQQLTSVQTTDVSPR